MIPAPTISCWTKVNSHACTTRARRPSCNYYHNTLLLIVLCAIWSCNRLPTPPPKQIPRMVKKISITLLMMHSAWDYQTWYNNLPKLICRFVLKSSILFKWIKTQPLSVEQSQLTSCYHGVPSAQAGVLQGALLQRKSQRVLRSLTRWKSLVTMELESL